MTTIIMRTSEGDITINLFDDKAPNTVAIPGNGKHGCSGASG